MGQGRAVAGQADVCAASKVSQPAPAEPDEKLLMPFSVKPSACGHATVRLSSGLRAFR